VSLQAERADQFAASLMPVIDGIYAATVTTLEGIAAALTARGVQTSRLA
jgi:hypothetical protein